MTDNLNDRGDERGAESTSMARWQGQMEATVNAIRRDTEERDKRYDERAEAQNKAVEAALAAQKEAVAAALAASDKAVDKAETNAEKWRDQANEWRGAMSDRDRELPSRREVDQAINTVAVSVSAISDAVSRIESRLDRGEGVKTGTQEQRMTLNTNAGLAIAGSSLFVVGVGVIASILATQ